MPDTLYYEPAQVAYMKTHSIKNEDGSEKPDNEKNQIAFEICKTVQDCKDVKDLYNSGFMLDSETTEYCAKLLHDMYQHIKDDWSEKKAEGYLNYYTLGNGDYSKGQELYQSYYNDYQDSLKEIQNLYQKLYSDELNQGMKCYNMRNTT